MTAENRKSVAVTVIVPAYKAAEELPVLLAALEAQTLAQERFDVIVAEDASTDATGAIAEEHGVRHVRTPRRSGSYAARNLALRDGTGPVVAFTDADCRPDPSWLEAGLAAMEREGTPLLAGRIDVPLRTNPSAAELLDVGGSFDQERTVRERAYAVTANLFVRREALDAVGGFDEYVISGGDRQFCLKAGAAGFPIAYADDVVVVHGPRTTGAELARKAWRYGVGRAQLPAVGLPDAALREELWRHPGAYLPRRGGLSLRRLDPHDYKPSRAMRARMRVVDYLFQRLPMLVGNVNGAAARARRERRGTSASRRVEDASDGAGSPDPAAGLRVAFVPSGLDDNPYQRLLTAALREQGIEVRDGVRIRSSSLTKVANEVDVIHLHWLEYAVLAPRHGGIAAARFALSVAAFAAALRRLRRRGVRIVWTVHNLAPHQPRFPRLQRLLTRSTARAVDSLVVHSEHAAGELARHGLARAPVVVAPHGNYVDAYPPPAGGRAEARRRFGLEPDAVVFLAFGRIRGYKRLAEIAEAFTRLDAPQARLVIAGAVDEGPLRDALVAMASRDDRISLRFGFADTAEAGALHCAADAAVVNHHELFSSGVVLLALSNSLPVLAAATGATAEIVPARALIAIGESGLTAAFAAALERDLAEAGAEARRAAETYPWSLTARRVVEAYRAAGA